MAILFGTPATTGLRFRSRHVHRTIAAFMEERLGLLGWTGDPVNFGTAPIIFKEVVPDENGAPIAANTVSISLGDIDEDALGQLGGGLWETILPVFFDVYGASASVAQSIAEDIKEQVTRGVVLPVYNWNEVAVPVLVAGEYIEFENVIGPERPAGSAVSQDFRRFWRIVKAEAHVYYQG